MFAFSKSTYYQCNFRLLFNLSVTQLPLLRKGVKLAASSLECRFPSSTLTESAAGDVAQELAFSESSSRDFHAQWHKNHWLQ